MLAITEAEIKKSGTKRGPDIRNLRVRQACILSFHPILLSAGPSLGQGYFLAL